MGKRNRWILMAALAVAAAAPGVFAGRMGRVDMSAFMTPIYTVEGDAFVRHNGDRYCNRPLYCNHISAVAFGGDKPYIMAGVNKVMLGNLMFAIFHNGKAKWLQNASDITSRYRPGRMEWTVKDASWGDVTVLVEVVPPAEGAGLAAHVRVENAQPDDQLLWASGGATAVREGVLKAWDVTVPGGEHLMARGFVPADCANNSVQTTGDSWTLLVADGRDVTSVGQCSAPSNAVVADAGAWKDPAALLASRGESEPIACGVVALTQYPDIYWSLGTPTNGNSQTDASAKDAFTAGMQRVEAIEKQVTVDTPDTWLNAAVGASCSVTDGVFRNNMYTHAGMRWGVPLIGWRTIYGGTVYGWHDHVKAEAALCIAKQITDSDKTTAHADPTKELASQAPDSRLFGKGRINIYQPYHYDMQSQFFDQIQHAWRWTGDPDLQKLLRPSLDLHCAYIKDCFDPDGDGIYESYANSWPTDDQWYNGGGTSEETAYAYRAERTALLLAQRAGDQAGIQRHEAAIARIKKGFFDLLWIPNRGYPGAYREQGGLKRLHESCWLYSIFCPIDAGLLNTEQSAQALQYTEWGLERDQMPYGGEECWPSNWVPSIWSVREMWPGDDYQLALAYFQTGLSDDGWNILHGTFPQYMFFGTVPGDLGHPAGATDFNDCASMFARTVVEGLFGYAPDYPDGIVKIAPEFPSGWDHASIKTPDVSIAFQRNGASLAYHITLAKASDLQLRLPVSTTGVQAVTVNGAPVAWTLDPGFGHSLIRIAVANASTTDVAITCRDVLKTYSAVHLSGNTGTLATLRPEDGTAIDFHDPQGTLKDAIIQDGAVTGTWTANAGDHALFVLTRQGDATQWRVFKVHITDVHSDAALAAKTDVDIPAHARWSNIAMQKALNGDIRTIYQQKYLSPRPNTCSLRLATDGYSTWQMVLDKKNHPPEITLDNIPSLLNAQGDILTRSGIPFLWPAGKNNIAFTSQWDNWPRQVEVPVNAAGDAVCFLLCGTTDPMEVRIANAELRMTYADGVVEKLEVIPPFNFWSLCPLDGVDYDYQRDGFALPKVPPAMVQLGRNCRAMVLKWRLRPGVALRSVTLATLSEQVVIGLMGVTVMNERQTPNP